MYQPNFEDNLLRIFKKEKPAEATMFEFLIKDEFCRRLAGHGQEHEGSLGQLQFKIDAMRNAGYDYVPCLLRNFQFLRKPHAQAQTRSLNIDAMIYDWETFEKYPWPDANTADYALLEKILPHLPEGMKLMVYGHDGIMENVMGLVGYENLCIMLYDDPELVQEIFNQVGSRLLRYYENVASAESVGFLCSNDDWGFNTQTFMSPEAMRRYLFPWHKKIVNAAHRQGKPCMLHSCGYFEAIIDDVIDDMKFDGRHSYEDSIMCVEDAYELLHGRIAVIGGIDMNYLVTRTPQEIYTRARAMLERTAERGGYALGSGNSIPDYIPYENFLALLRAGQEMKNM